MVLTAKKPNWKNTFLTPKFFDDTRVKLTYFTVALVLPISNSYLYYKPADELATCQALNDHSFFGLTSRILTFTVLKGHWRCLF